MRGRFCKIVFSEQDVILGFVAEFDAMAHTVTAILLLFSFAYGSQACPANITVSVLSPSSVNVSWYLNDTGGTYVCSVRVYAGSLAIVTLNTTCGTVFEQDLSENRSLGFSQTVENLCPRTDYTFSVEVNDTECPPLQSGPFSINATMSPAGAVGDFRVVAEINSSADPSSKYRITINASWSDPSPESELCTRTEYVLTWRSNGVSLNNSYPTAGPYTLHNFTANSSYEFTIFLNTVGGPGDPAENNITTPPDIPSAPTNPSIAVISSSSLRFQWGTPVAPNTHSLLTYNVYLDPMPAASTSFVRQTTDRQIQIDGYNPYERVCFRVSASNSQGKGPNTTELCSRTGEAAPGPVSKLSYARLTNTSVVISWEPPQQPRGVIAAYFLIQLGFGGVFTTAEHFIKLDNLVPFRSYSVQVRARNGAGFGEVTLLHGVFTDQDVPGKVTSLLLSRLSGNSTNIRWSPPASLRGVILGYEVAYTPRGSLTQIHSSLMHSASTSLVIQGLSPNQAYDVRVRARTVAGYGPYSSTETAPVLRLPSVTSTNGSNILQLCLSGSVACDKSNTMALKKMVQLSLTSQLTGYCDCGRLVTDTTETRLLCNAEPRRIIFRAMLEERDAVVMLPTVKQWVSSPSPYLYVNGRALWVDSTCSLLIDSFSSSSGLTQSSSAAGALAGTFFAALILGILATVGAGFLVLLVLWCVGSNKDDSPQQSPVRYKKGNASDAYEYLDIAEGNAGSNRTQDEYYEHPEPPSSSGQKRKSKRKQTDRGIGKILPTATRKQAQKPPQKSRSKQHAVASQPGNQIQPQQIDDNSGYYVMDPPAPTNVPMSSQAVPAPPQTVPAPPQTVPAPPQTVPAPPQTVPAPPNIVPVPPQTVRVPAPPQTVPAPPQTVPAPPQIVPPPPNIVPVPPKIVPPSPNIVPVPPKTVPAPPQAVRIPAPPQIVPAPPQIVPAPPQTVPAPPQTVHVPAPFKTVPGPPHTANVPAFPQTVPTSQATARPLKKALLPPKKSGDKPVQANPAPPANPKGKTFPTTKPKPVGKSTAGIHLSSNKAYQQRTDWVSPSPSDVAKTGAMKK